MINEAYYDRNSSLIDSLEPPTRLPALVKLVSPELANIHYTEGDILQRYEFGEELANTERGGQGTVLRAKRKSDGLDVVVKIYSGKETGDWDKILHEEKRAGREIKFLERANAHGVKGLPVLVEYGAEGYGIRTPVAIFEPIPGKSLEDVVRDPNYNPDIESIWNMISGLREPLEYAHKKNGAKPVIHRDVNPGNIMVNGHPVLIDWAGASNPSTGKTIIRTYMYTKYFTSPEMMNDGEVDERTDIYGLGKVAQYMILGQEVFNAVDGIPAQRDFQNMNIPRDVVSVLEKATQEKPENRYRNIADFYDAFANAIGRSLPVPTTAGKITKLERVTPLESGTENIIRNFDLSSSLPSVVDYGDGKITIDEVVRIDKGKDVCETARNIRREMDEKNNLGWVGNKYKKPLSATDVERLKHQAVLAYLDHVSPNHPTIDDAFNGRKTLEDAVKEKGPSSLRREFKLLEAAFANVTGGNYETPTTDQEHKEEKKLFDERRKDLCEVFGEVEPNTTNNYSILTGMFGGAGAGLAGLIASATFGIKGNSLQDSPSYLTIALPAFIGAALGAVGLPLLSNYNTKRKLLREAREMDSWIHEARVSQGLEKRVENVVLTKEERGKIASASAAYSLVPGFGSMFFSTDKAITVLLSTGVYAASSLILNKYLTSRALKQKRLAAGLDGDGMREYYREDIKNLVDGTIKEVLPLFGFKKKFFKNKFIDNGVKVEYMPYLAPEDYKYHTLVTVNATSQDKADAVIAKLKEAGLVRGYNEISSGEDYGGGSEKI